MIRVEILTVLLSYLFLRVISPQYLDSVHIYASYAFELVIVLWALARLSTGSEFYLKPSKQLGAITLLLALSGWGAHSGATHLGLVVPFDTSSLETKVFLLLVAPVLEELLFRHTFWKQLEAFRLSKTSVWMFTSIFFSLAHLNAIRFVPNDLFTFIYYQTVYTLLLGLACGWVREKQTSVVPSILLHAAFNLGFFLGMNG